MGKVLSFVVLCIINFTVCRTAMSLDEGRSLDNLIPIRYVSLLVNGDDCVFPLRKFLNWEKTAAIVGWSNSLGKTFFSATLAEMNSRTFLPSVNEEGFIEWFAVPFGNFGLIKGLQRSTGQEGCQYEDMACLGERHTELIKELPFLFKDLDYLFRGYNKTRLNDDCLSGIPYYIPKWLGGLGLNPSTFYKEMISKEQRQQAYLIFSEYQNSKPVSVSGLKDSLLDSIIAKQYELNFKNLEPTGKHSLSTSFTKLITWEEELVDLYDENLTVYNLLAEWNWRSKSIFELLQGKEFNLGETPVHDANIGALSRKKIKTSFRHNGKLWCTAYRKLKEKIPKLFWHKIWHQKDDDLLLVVEKSRAREHRFLLDGCW
jgi:hypothetical protein